MTLCWHPDPRGGTTQVVQYGAIDHVPSYNLSRGVVLFVPNCTTHVVPLLPWPGTRPDCNWYVSVVFTLLAVATALVYTNRSLAALLLLLLCLPAAANFYIVVSQDVVTVAVVLEMHACVGRDQHLSWCCLLFPLRHRHVCALALWMHLDWFNEVQYKLYTKFRDIYIYIYIYIYRNCANRQNAQNKNFFLEIALHILSIAKLCANFEITYAI